MRYTDHYIILLRNANTDNIVVGVLYVNYSALCNTWAKHEDRVAICDQMYIGYGGSFWHLHNPADQYITYDRLEADMDAVRHDRWKDAWFIKG